jgi:hypothetical protein
MPGDKGVFGGFNGVDKRLVTPMRQQFRLGYCDRLSHCRAAAPRTTVWGFGLQAEVMALGGH